MTATIRGAGIGLRSLHYSEILHDKPTVPWFEVLSDNYFVPGGQPLYYLDKIRQNYPVTLHGVGMSLASADPLNLDYLTSLKHLAARVEPAYISDHLSWSSIEGHYVNDLIPLPYTEESLELLVARIGEAQEFLGGRILIENPSTYITFTHSTLEEWEFLRALVEKADCYLLLDVNNVYVTCTNHGYDPLVYLAGIPVSRVKQIHLAGYEDKQDYLFDTHSYPVHAPVWELYKEAVKRFGSVPSLIEWDRDIPAFAVLMKEANKAQAILDGV